jgi:hypothetical protein
VSDVKPVSRRMMDRVNSWVVGLRSSPRVGALVRRRVTVISYTGRRSGRRFSTPVVYRRRGDIVMIAVKFPDGKRWWRNFLGEGGPMTLELDDVERTGHAVAERDEKGRVTVTVRLDGAAG